MIRRVEQLNPVIIIGIVLGAAALIVGVYGYIYTHGSFDLGTFLSDFYANISAEFASIAITVIVIDQLNQRRTAQQQQANLKERLIREAGSRVNGIARNALEELRVLGWLTGADSLLQEAKLGHSDLQEAFLWEANLRGANLSYARLEGAHLFRANLQDVDLRGAKFDNKTILPDAKRDPETQQYTPESYWSSGVDMSKYTDPDHPEFWQPEWVKEQENKT